MERGSDDADGGFNAVITGVDAAKVRESSDKPDGSVAAHSQIADIIEKDNASSTGTIGRFNEAGPDYDVGPARLVDDGRTQAIVLRTQGVQFVGNAAVAQVGSATDQDTSGFSAGMRIDDGNAFHGEPPFAFANALGP